MTPYEMPFDKPIAVTLQGGLEHIFQNVYDTLDFLENEWPLRTGPCYQAAIAACRDALGGSRSARFTRTALLAACQEAGLVPGPVRLALKGHQRAA